MWQKLGIVFITILAMITGLGASSSLPAHASTITIFSSPAIVSPVVVPVHLVKSVNPSMYTVRPGDTLWDLARTYLGNPFRWPVIFHANPTIRNPDLIYVGQRLDLNTSRFVPVVRRSEVSRPATATQLSSGLSGTLGCSGLEALWRAAGGSSVSAFTAAEVAMAESSGRQFATGPFGERGYWQISNTWGVLSTFNALGNAKAAVVISRNGSNWTPWTTFNTGAYRGKCLNDFTSTIRIRPLYNRLSRETSQASWS